MTTISFRAAQRMQGIKPSLTMAITARAAELRAEGIDVISFSAGEPDFDTPEHIKQAVREALGAEGQPSAVSKYTPVQGIPALRDAAAQILSAAHGIELKTEQLMVSCGAKHSLFNVFMAMLNPGDEVVIPAPYWVSYPAMVELAGGRPVIVDTAAGDGFLIEPPELRAAISDRTRALVLNTPCNPTGALYDRARLEAIASIILEHDLLVISDDIYRSLVYGDAVYHSIASLAPKVAARTILVDGVSKTYAMTGWRIGFTAGPVELIAAMSKLQGQSTSNPSHISQIAALAALTGSQDCVAEMREAFDERRQVMVELLRALPEVSCTEPLGAFYAFPDLSAYVGTTTPDGRVIDSDVALCEYLVTAGKIAIVPGSGFGAPGCARLSYACGIDDIRTGLSRMGQALAELS